MVEVRCAGGMAQTGINAEQPPYLNNLYRVARNFQLRVLLKEGRRRETFDGFLREVRSLVFALD
jgi:hypothetical protein